MSENKNNVNVKEDIKVKDEVKEELKITDNEVEDEYSVSAFDDEDDRASAISHTEKLFKTKYPIQTVQRNVNGAVRDNYAVAFLTSIGGQKVRSVLRVMTNKKGGENLRSLMKVVMSSPGTHNLEILKRTFRNASTNETTTVYSMQVSCVSDEGVPFTCPLTPVGPADTAIWENLKRQLIARGELE